MEIAATLVGLVESAGLAALVELAGPVESAGLAVSVVLVAPVELAERAALLELVAGIARPRCPRVVADAGTGNTIQHTAAEPRIETERPRTDLEVPRAATPSPTDRPAPGNKLEGREAICKATAAEHPLQATGPVALAVPTGLEAEAERIA